MANDCRPYILVENQVNPNKEQDIDDVEGNNVPEDIQAPGYDQPHDELDDHKAEEQEVFEDENMIIGVDDMWEDNAEEDEEEELDHIPENPQEQAQDDIEQAMDNRYGARTGRYDLHPQRPRDYSHFFAQQITSDQMITSQMSMKHGLALFGEAGIEAVQKEMLQLHNRKVMKPIHGHTLTRDQRKHSLAYLMFLKKKRCGTIKARGCADGRKQQDYIPKEEDASPTIANESIFLTAVIDAYKGRDVAIVDVPGAFMQADMDELVHVRFTRTMVNLLVEIDKLTYGPYVIQESGEPVLYIELLKALYGTL
jgi:hypothetical protein